MTKPPNLLKTLLRERHWQKYATFCKEWDRVAGKLDPDLVGAYPSRSQLARWLAGGLKTLPHPDACRILEGLFPGLNTAQLFATAQAAREPEAREPSRPNAVMPSTSGPRPAFGDVPSCEVRAERVRPTIDGTLSEEIAMAAEESARFVRRARGAVDQDVLDQLDADLRRMAHDYLVP